MGRRGISLVIAVAAAGCAPELPRGIHVEASFTDDEASLCAEAIVRANERLGFPLVGGPALVDLGRYADPDGFHDEDFDDDVGVIYPLDPASAEYHWLADTNEREYEGYGTRADVLVAYRLPPAPTDADRRHFRQIIMHELGHFLGIPHTSERNAIMYSGADRLEHETYTPVDQEAFCLVYGC